MFSCDIAYSERLAASRDFIFVVSPRCVHSVLAWWEWHAKGERSGIDVSSDWFALWTLRNGRIARLRFFYDRAEALEAAGLRE
jgi:ketosteroid isomerase-like protein